MIPVIFTATLVLLKLQQEHGKFKDLIAIFFSYNREVFHHRYDFESLSFTQVLLSKPK